MVRLYISVVDANSKKGQEEAHVGIAGSTKPRSTQSSESAARTHGWEGTEGTRCGRGGRRKATSSQRLSL